ncbi:MAG: glycoside hydrolase family 78 protein [Fimbriimonadales bacterium]|nr:glycoside hydrolase family 78 protein [Fimbriimonadales bacterium]
MENPLGVEARHPRLSWKLEATDPSRRGLRQTAYQIQVSRSPELLAQDQPDVWDSGKVSSDQSVLVPYGGPALADARRYWWRVRVWTDRREASGWSPIAHWTMGLTGDDAWKALWIGPPRPAKARSLAGCTWIWTGEPGMLGGVRWFEASFEFPAEARSAELLMTADDRFEAFLDGAEVARTRTTGTGEDWRTVVRADLGERLSAGRHTLRVKVQNDGGPAGLIARLTADGRDVLKTDAGWRWAETLEGLAEGRPAAVVGVFGGEPWGEVGPDPGPPPPAPMLRKEFHLRPGLERALLFVSALGYGRITINGHPATDSVLDPPFTRYDRRVLYTAHDVTRLLKGGSNAIGAVLGNGFLNVPARDAWNFERAPWREPPMLRLQLVLEFADGAIERVVSDGTWRLAEGPWRFDAVRQGEVYDARLEQSGWDEPGFDDSSWRPVSLLPGPKGRAAALRSAPCRVTETLRPRTVREVQPGVFVFDLGQNIAGWARFRVRGPAGTEVRLRFAEKLRPDGTVDTSNIDGLVFDPFFSQVRYTLKGGGPETFESAFAYYGFRYVQVEGWPGRPTLDDLEGRVVHTDFARAGDVRSTPLFDRIQDATLWAYRSNFVGIPTDCPHREKNGWTGDAHLAAEQALFNWDNAAGYLKWLDDLMDEQREDGALPGIVPTGGWGYAWGNGPAWDSALVLIPYYLYLYTGDRGVLERCYPAMRRYVDYLERNSRRLIVPFGLGDWVPAKTETPADITSTAYFAVDAEIVSLAATLLGRVEDAARYGTLAKNIRSAWRAEFVRDDGTVGPGSQTAQSCALFQDMLKLPQRPQVYRRLVERVERDGGRLDVGILGAKYLFHTLSEGGSHELALDLLTRTDQPSYGWWLEQGATTLWETWDGNASRNHIMFGDVSAWFFQQLAGIRPDPSMPGFKRVLLEPKLSDRVPTVRAWHDGPFGRIVSEIEHHPGGYSWVVHVPPNSSAVATIPAPSIENVTEGGKPLRQAEGVRVRTIRLGREVVVGLLSGRYRFEVRR